MSYAKVLIIMTIAALYCSCEKEEPKTVRSPRLKQVELETSFDHPVIGLIEHTSTKDYRYNDKGRLTHMLDDSNTYDIIYDGPHIKEIWRKNEDDVLLRRDSFTYLPKGHLDQEFSINHGKIIRSRTFTYDDDGLLQKIEHYKGDELFQTQKLYWMDGNVTRVEIFQYDLAMFGQPNGLSFVYEYEYDEGRNPFQNLPLAVDLCHQWSENNMVRSVLTDYVGILDVLCSDCSFEYSYNDFGLPEEMIQDFGHGVISRTKISYE